MVISLVLTSLSTCSRQQRQHLPPEPRGERAAMRSV